MTVLATDLAEVLQHYLDSITPTLTPVTSRNFIQPGEEVAWDECCNGQLWIRVVGLEPQMSTVKGNGQPCGVLWWDALLAVGVIRCVHVVDDRGVAPTAAELTEDALQMVADLTAIQQAIICDPITTRMMAWVPLGPQGGCAGGEQRFVVRLAPCGCPEVPSP